MKMQNLLIPFAVVLAVVSSGCIGGTNIGPEAFDDVVPGIDETTEQPTKYPALFGLLESDCKQVAGSYVTGSLTIGSRARVGYTISYFSDSHCKKNKLSVTYQFMRGWNPVSNPETGLLYLNLTLNEVTVTPETAAPQPALGSMVIVNLTKKSENEPHTLSFKAVPEIRSELDSVVLFLEAQSPFVYQ